MILYKAFIKQRQRFRGRLTVVLPALWLASGFFADPGVQADTAVPAATTVQATYTIHHSLVVKDIPQGAKRVRIWFWMPQDDPAQKILDFAVSVAPTGYKITRDPTYGHQYLYCEVSNSAQNTVALATDFTLLRHAISVALDPEQSGALPVLYQQTFANYLRRDTPFMEVDLQTIKLADEICGGETNGIRQARKIYDYMIDHADHYSKGEVLPSHPRSAVAVDTLRLAPYYSPLPQPPLHEQPLLLIAGFLSSGSFIKFNWNQ